MENKDTILAIDDNNVNLMMLSAMLAQEYNVATVNDARKAVTDAVGIQPALILLDVYMPGKDGLAICRELKQNQYTSKIPVIIVSGRTGSQEIVDGLQAGADDYITKPFSTEELRLRIRRLVKLTRPQVESARQSARLMDENEQLRKSAMLNGIIGDTTSEAILITTPGGTIIAATPACRKVLGTPPQAAGKQIFDILTSDDDKANLIPMIDQIAADGQDTKAEYLASRPGSDKPLIIEATGHITDHNINGEPLIAIRARTVNLQDHSQSQKQKELEIKLLSQEKEIMGYFKYSANGIITVNANLEIIRYNKRFLEIFSINKRQNYHQVAISKLIGGETLQEIQKLIDKVGKPPLFETASLSCTNDDGQKVFIEATASRLNLYGEDTLLLIFTDVTRIRNMDSAILSASSAAEERERTHLAQELHDGMGALLSSINIYLNLILSGGADIDEMFRTLRLAKDLVGQAIENVKEIANNLHPVILTRFGLVATINNIIEGLESSRLIKFQFSHADFRGISDKNMELSVYRMMNEMINNTLKYAEARNVEISLANQGNLLKIHYQDNGKGFRIREQQLPAQGRGLSNIIGRVKTLNGICNINSEPGKGVRIDIEIPYNEN